MEPRSHPVEPQKKSDHFYLSIMTKFWISHGVSLFWMLFSIWISLPWLHDLADLLTYPFAILMIGGIAYIPGYLNAFLVMSLLLDKQPTFKNEWPNQAVTILIAAYNEEHSILNTLAYLNGQDYKGYIHVMVIDNNSSDRTKEKVLETQQEFNLNISYLFEATPGKFHALNYGLKHVTTPYVITLDADTLIHPSAVRFLMARMISSPPDVVSVAGSMLVRNSRESIWTRIQEWDYFLGIASIKRLQGLYQGTLVAQGAFSLYNTSAVKEVGGWPDAIGEDIVLTWRLLKMHHRVFFEPLAVAFTDAPTEFRHFARQRSRWARGMIEGLKEIKPWAQPRIYTKYLTGVNLAMPYIDIVFTLFWIPGLVLALFGYYWIVGPMTLFVLPLTIVSYGTLYFYQKNYVFKQLGLRIRRNFTGFLLFIAAYQIVMAPISVWGYIQELFQLRRIWK
ncbi:glycosyltransferase family 2 protein [Thalassobacillus devorans]|uniref:glycosyltransferase family 2 protein n=1 Tax=Thalassobacillus devorans TaxID=279813 RepID=UPI000A1CCECF|nr:glycosyltransferase [Thalassobacillus devorans]